MIVGVQGTPNFGDYKVLLRGMAVAMSMLKIEDPYFEIYSAGPGNINNMVSEFTNLSERGMKARGKKIKFHKVAPSWISENIKEFDYIVYLASPNEQSSKLVTDAQDNNVEVGIFRY
jgi:protein-tyrosine-phosphatase